MVCLCSERARPSFIRTVHKLCIRFSRMPKQKTDNQLRETSCLTHMKTVRLLNHHTICGIYVEATILSNVFNTTNTHQALTIISFKFFKSSYHTNSAVYEKTKFVIHNNLYVHVFNILLTIFSNIL